MLALAGCAATPKPKGDFEAPVQFQTLAGVPPVLDGGAAFVVGGRSGTTHNARQIADTLAASIVDDDRWVVLVGYSKGGLDNLHFLVDVPELAAPVDTVVGVATPTFGTLLGYASADHWGITQTIESEHPVLVARPDPSLFPLK